uniref:Uncharacterized protein n=1 Tax=Peronospora matthiolae TaxID=2874970 RepID=A0AAV1TJA5_9STRA
MRAAQEITSQASAASDYSPAVAREQHAVPVATLTRGESPRATDASAASAADAATHNLDEPETELIYSGESNASFESKAAPPAFG